MLLNDKKRMEEFEMKTLFCYDKCSTCRKAIKKLKELNIEYTAIDVKKDVIDENVILELLKRQGQPKRMFNTSGNVYKEMQLKNTIHQLTIEEMAQLLSTHGMLLKRPLLFDEKICIIGYDEEAYDSIV